MKQKARLAWVFASRPKTLVAGIAPISTATALVYLSGYPIDWMVFTCALVCTLSLQIATNFFNDAIDFKKGADTPERIGPTRATASGAMSFRSLMIFGIVALGVAVASGIPLILVGGKVFFALGFLSLFFAYAYTGGPLPLAYLGLGEVFVIGFFGFVAVQGTYFLQTLDFSLDASVLGIQQGLLAAVLLVINNARDIDQDRIANKKTLAVRFGLNFARVEVALFFVLAAILNFHWLFIDWPLLFALLWLPFVLALKLTWDVTRAKPSKLYNRFLATGGLVQLIFSFQFCLGVWLEGLL